MRLKRKSSGLRGAGDNSKGHEEAPCKKLKARNSHSKVITMPSTEHKNIFSILKLSKCFASLCCLVIHLHEKASVKLYAFQKKSVLSRHSCF